MKTRLLALFVESDLHETVRRAAFEERYSMSELVRRALLSYREPTKTDKRRGA